MGFLSVILCLTHVRIMYVVLISLLSACLSLSFCLSVGLSVEPTSILEFSVNIRMKDFEGAASCSHKS
jgi:hypothetical protein